MDKRTLSVVRALPTAVWAIEPIAANGWLPIVARILNGEAVEIEEEDPRNHMRVHVVKSMEDESSEEVFQDEESPFDIGDIDQDAVVTIPLMGPLFKRDSWCEMGNESRARMLRECYANKNVKGVILYADTPGGEAAACQVLLEAINERNKPVIVFVDGCLASAGVGSTVNADEIVLAYSDCVVGSIGTMINFEDVRGWDIFKGIKWHSIYADASTDKNRELNEALNNNYKPMKDGILNPANDIFLGNVRTYRPNVKEEALTGKVFYAAEALTMGLADRIGNLNSIIDSIMFGKNKSGLQSLDKFKGKKTLSAKELAEVQATIKAAGLDAILISGPKSVLMETAGDEPNIYVYAEEGEDPTGKRCVLADDAGQPTEENVPDGDYAMADGSTLTVAAGDDGMSYVQAVTPAGEGDASGDTSAEEGNQEEGDGKQAAAKTPKAKAVAGSALAASIVSAITPAINSAIEDKFKALRAELIPGSEVQDPKGANTNQGAFVLQPSAIEKRMSSIQENYEKRMGRK